MDGGQLPGPGGKEVLGSYGVDSPWPEMWQGPAHALYLAGTILACSPTDGDQVPEGRTAAQGHPALPAPAACPGVKSEPGRAGQRAAFFSLFWLGCPLLPRTGSCVPFLLGRLSRGPDGLSSCQVQAGGAALLRRHGFLPRPGHPLNGESHPPGQGAPSGLEGPRVTLGMAVSEPRLWCLGKLRPQEVLSRAERLALGGSTPWPCRG